MERKVPGDCTGQLHSRIFCKQDSKEEKDHSGRTVTPNQLSRGIQTKRSKEVVVCTEVTTDIDREAKER